MPHKNLGKISFISKANKLSERWFEFLEFFGRTISAVGLFAFALHSTPIERDLKNFKNTSRQTLSHGTQSKDNF